MDKINIDKVKLESSNIADENFEKLASLFPNVVTETIVNDRVERVIDVDKLKQEINSHVVEGLEERYNFTWPDKRKSVVLANAPTRNTLRPCIKESKDFDKTENLYIEGDNLEVLKLLRNTYLGQVKMIYIDPPYNTGKDFVYKDKFFIDKEDYLENSGQFEEGNRLFENTEANGRFHTDWLNMMYPRLKMARDLLTDDGVIFISIDDNEVSNLRKICDEIFGERNFVADFIRKTKSSTNDAKTGLNYQHEMLLCFAKNKYNANLLGGSKNLSNYQNPDNDPNGVWVSADPTKAGYAQIQNFPILNPYTQQNIYPPIGRSWVFTKNTIQKYIDEGRICFKKEYKDNERGFIYKRYLKDLQTTLETFDSLKFTDNKFMNQVATKELKDLELVEYFPYPKGCYFLKEIIIHGSDKDSIILDFFSGSSTTAHAVMQLNAEDGGGNRKFIMVQLPAETPEKSEARKAGYSTICEIGKERIRRAGEKIKKEYPNANIDTGFRVFKLDSSNMEDVYYKAEDLSQQDINKQISNIKDDRSEEDLLFQIILSNAIPLTCKIEIKKINNRKVYFVNDTYLFVCFENHIDDKTIEELAKMKPEIMVFNQNTSDSTLVNIEQIFKQISPTTIMNLI